MPAQAQQGVAHAVADSLQTVFLVAAPIAALALLVLLRLKEVPLRGPDQKAPAPGRGAVAHAAR